MPGNSPHESSGEVGHKFTESLGIIGDDTLRIIVQIKGVGVDGGRGVDRQGIEGLGILLPGRIEA